MGFPSPATDYIEDRLNLNKLCGICPTSQLYEHNGEIYVIDRSVSPRRGDAFIYELYGQYGIGKMQGKALITSDGEAIEGPVLDDIMMLGTVTFTILTHYEDYRPTI